MAQVWIFDLELHWQRLPFESFLCPSFMKCKIYNEAIWSACWRLFGVGGSCVGDVNLIADDDVSGEEMRALKKSIQTTRTTTCHNGHYRTSFQ